MALPDLIEIVPLDKPVRAEITVPGSKSITNRALVLAALADGEVTLNGALWSEDTQIMVECLQELGFMVNVADDPNEFCNRTITVYGKGGTIPNGGTQENPLELYVGNAGTAARFLSAMVCLGNGVYRLHGIARMHERPQAALFKALRELGYRVEAEQGNDKLPVKITGGRHGHATAMVSIEESSQFASALLLCAKIGGWDITVSGENAEESPYVVMTSKLIEAFPHRGGKFQIEPDASGGSYFLAVDKLLSSPEWLEYSHQFKAEMRTQFVHPVIVIGWPHSGWQIDERFKDFTDFGPLFPFMRRLGNKGIESRPEEILQFRQGDRTPDISRQEDLGDSIMTAIAVSAEHSANLGLWAPGSHIRYTDLGRLRVQECERVLALRTELTKCGAKVVEEGDTLTVYPSKLHGAEIETYNDHRMAMCFAVLGLKVPGIKLRNPACVKKTFPNFFQKLAAPAPHGLGATILDGKTGCKLEMAELFAD